jgi:hypothetical protein
MTSLQNPAATDTALPGSTRRRVWHAPEVRSHPLVVLTASRLYLLPPDHPPTPELLAALEDGTDQEEVLGPQATAIDLTTARRVAHDLTANTLELEYAIEGRPAEETVVFATPEASDAAFALVWRRLGEGFELTPPRLDPWSAARGPVAAMLGVLVTAAALALGASAADDFPAASSPLAAVLRAMDWRAVCGVAGAALAVIQVRLYRRLTRPPSRLELVRR